ncbi:MAG TPA: serine/threonine-protein kinase [Vicinamibacteria bacterium]|jgi:serine/threonine-protein kinase
MASANPSAPLPDHIGRYKIEAELGRGMMGVIYKAADPDLGRTVALKTVALAFTVSEDDREAFRRRFLEEARIAARLSHPGIVVVHEVGRDAETGLLYMSLEYLRGRTLAQIMTTDGRLRWEEAMRLGGRVAAALHHAHGEGVVHRDIKPANIMVLETGEPKLLDFGVAKAPTQQLTAAGQFFGTPAYMSPEQACGLNVDGRSDLFSLGCVLYQAMTGSVPFTADSIPLLLSRILNEDPPLPSSVAPEIPPEVDILMRRLLAKDRQLRYADGEALAADIDDILEHRPLRPFSQRPEASTAVAAGLTEPPEDTLDLRLSFLLDEDPAVDASVAPPPGAAVVGPLAPTVPSRPTMPRQWLIPSALLGAGAAAMLALFALTSRRLDPPPLPSTAAAPTATVETAETTSAPVPPPAGEPEPPVPAPAADAGPAAARPQPPARSARLQVRLDHHLRDGTLRVWVDDQLRLEQALRAQRTRNLLFVRLYRGRVAETLPVSPGRHRVRAEVAWDGRQARDLAIGHFEAGQTRRLEVTVGMLRKTVELQWR